MKLTVKHSYESYPHDDVTEKEYFRIIYSFLKKIPRYLIDDAKAIVLLSRLGTVQIMKYKPQNRRPIDWQNSRKYGRRIYHDNLATDGFSACLRWSKKWSATFKYKSLWSLAMTRDNLRPNNGKVNPNCLSETIKREGIRKYKSL